MRISKKVYEMKRINRMVTTHLHKTTDQFLRDYAQEHDVDRSTMLSCFIMQLLDKDFLILRRGTSYRIVPNTNMEERPDTDKVEIPRENKTEGVSVYLPSKQVKKAFNQLCSEHYTTGSRLLRLFVNQLQAEHFELVKTGSGIYFKAT